MEIIKHKVVAVYPNVFLTYTFKNGEKGHLDISHIHHLTDGVIESLVDEIEMGDGDGEYN